MRDIYICAAKKGGVMYEIELIHLAHFNEASFGLCIAFTIIDDVHQWGQKMCEIHRKKSFAEWGKRIEQAKSIKEPTSSETLGKAEQILSNDGNNFSEVMESRISTLKKITFGIGLWFYFLLAYLGSNPSANYPFWIILICVFLPGIVPLVFIGWIVLQWDAFYQKLCAKLDLLDGFTTPPKS
jgi:hypothetical protein